MPDVAGDTFRFLLLVGIFLIAALLVVACILLAQLRRRPASHSAATDGGEAEDTWQEAAASADESQWAARAIRATADAPPAVDARQPATGEGEEGPYERDGRWWFRRGEELRVYDAATGQWVPASDEPSDEPLAQTVAPPESAAPVAATPTQSGFWKCAVCSAVNAASARTCRMCFAARPET